MSVSFVIILSTIFVSFVRSDPPRVICEYAGSSSPVSISPPYTFDVAEVPDRCEVVAYGEYGLNITPSNSDETAIKALTSAGKAVYMIYNCPLQDPKQWANIINDPKLLDAFIAPMLAYLKVNNKIAGVILATLGAFEGNIPDYAKKITTIIGKIKECGPSLKTGVLIEAFDSYRYNSNKDFDFTVTNEHVDFYVVNLWSITVLCRPNLSAAGGRYPITSNEKDITTLTQLCKDINNCPIAKDKLVVNIADQVTWLESPGGMWFMKSYSQYCSKKNTGGVWCADTIQLIYGEIIFLKQTFKGIMITFMEFDDTANTCGCGQFPVANTQMDALEGKPIKCCDKIS